MKEGRAPDGPEQIRLLRAAGVEGEQERAEKAPRRHGERGPAPPARPAGTARGARSRSRGAREAPSRRASGRGRARVLAAPRGVPFPVKGPTTSCASAEASEFRAEDSEHIAAEKIPATRYAETSPGRCRTMKVGKISSGEWNAASDEAAAGSIGRPWKKAKSITPIERKSVICRRTTKPLPDQGLARVLQAAAGEQPLHDQLVGAVARHRQERAAEDPGPERVGAREIELEMEEVRRLPRGGVGGERARKSRRESGSRGSRARGGRPRG